MPYAIEEVRQEHKRAMQRGWRTRRAARADNVTNVAVPVSVWEEAKRAHKAGYPTLTAFLLRDPLPGRSALDKMENVHASA